MLCRKDGLAWKALILGKEHEEPGARGIPLPGRTSQSAAGKQRQRPHLAPLASVTASYRRHRGLLHARERWGALHFLKPLVPRGKPERAGGRADISVAPTAYLIIMRVDTRWVLSPRHCAEGFVDILSLKAPSRWDCISVHSHFADGETGPERWKD